MSVQTWFFAWLGVMALVKLIRSHAKDPLKPTVSAPRRRLPPRRIERSSGHRSVILRSRIYIPAGLLEALERADRLDEPWATLPPGERDPELETLLEWIANAKPGEVLEIVSEIKRHYHNTGDKKGGDALKRALRQSLKAVGMPEREAILRHYEPYTREARIPHVWIEDAEPSR
jgi:hypothetical protein